MAFSASCFWKRIDVRNVYVMDWKCNDYDDYDGYDGYDDYDDYDGYDDPTHDFHIPARYTSFSPAI